MPSDAHGISVRIAGWTGSVSLQRGVDTVTVTSTGTQSPVQVWKALYDAALVQWGAGKVYGIFPKGSAAGLQHEPKAGKQTKVDNNGLMWEVYRDRFKWYCGLVVRARAWVVGV